MLGLDWHDCVILHALIPHLHLVILAPFFCSLHILLFCSACLDDLCHCFLRSLPPFARPVSALVSPSLLTARNHHQAPPTAEPYLPPARLGYSDLDCCCAGFSLTLLEILNNKASFINTNLLFIPYLFVAV